MSELCLKTKNKLKLMHKTTDIVLTIHTFKLH